MLKKIFLGLESLFLSFAAVACGEAEIVVPDSLSIVSLQPTDGALNIDNTIKPSIAFSAPLNADQNLAEYIDFQINGSTDVPYTVNYEQGNMLVVITPEASLAVDTRYLIRVKNGIIAAQNALKPLPVTVTSSFRTAK